MNAKKLMYIRYENAGCIVKTFDSFNESIRFVHSAAGDRDIKLSVTRQRRIHRKIRDAINNKVDYFGGQWCFVPNTETNIL